MVFLFIIHSGILASSWHLHNWCASHSWMVVYTSMSLSLSIQHFLEFCSEQFQWYHRLRALFDSFQFSFHIICPFSLFSVPISYSKIVLLSLHPVVGLSKYILHQLVDRIFFWHFGISFFVCIVCPCSRIFKVFLLSLTSFYLSLQATLIFSLFCFGLPILAYPYVFFLP